LDAVIASLLQPQQPQQEMTIKLVTSLLSRSTATVGYNDFWNGIDCAANASKQFWNIAFDDKLLHNN